MPSPRPTTELAWLAETIAREIPLAEPMGVRIEAYDAAGLRLSMPLEPNRNPHHTAFAGSLNALCTLAGWGMAHLLLAERRIDGSTVLQRSSIKYRAPVQSTQVNAVCLPPTAAEMDYFLSMLSEKHQAKLELAVQIASENGEGDAVLFGGSYVVTLADPA